MPIRSLAALLPAGMLLALAAGCDATQGTPAPALPPPVTEAEPDGPPLFEDITAASGIDFTYRNGEDTADHLAILESLGGGAGLIDFDGDGLLDVFLPGGGGYAGPDKKDIVGRPCKMYRRLCSATWTTSASGAASPWPIRRSPRLITRVYKQS